MNKQEYYNPIMKEFENKREQPKIKCSKQNCEEEALYFTGQTRATRKCWCVKHYAERIRKQPNVKGNVNWECEE